MKDGNFSNSKNIKNQKTSLKTCEQHHIYSHDDIIRKCSKKSFWPKFWAFASKINLSKISSLDKIPISLQSRNDSAHNDAAFFANYWVFFELSANWIWFEKNRHNSNFGVQESKNNCNLMNIMNSESSFTRFMLVNMLHLLPSV